MSRVASGGALARVAPAGATVTAFLLLLACSSSTTKLPAESAASALDTGAVEGAIRLNGGPAGTASRTVAGKVFAYRDADLSGDPVATAKAATNGRFDLRLPAGRYYLA